jgi:LPS-assembly protein
VYFRPNNTWNWAVGYLYLRGSLFGTPESLYTSTFYYRFNENWGLRVQHWFDAENGTLQQQYYTIYRDLRSWTAGLTLRVTDDTTHGTQFTFAATFSLKALPRFGLGQDSVSPPSLIGY